MAHELRSTPMPARKLVRLFGKIVRQVSRHGGNANQMALKSSMHEQIFQKFARDWLPQIIAHATGGPCVLKIDTDFAASTPHIESRIVEFFQGTGFGVVEFGRKSLHRDFAVVSFVLSWLD